MITKSWWMKLGGNWPPTTDPLLFSISGTGSSRHRHGCTSQGLWLPSCGALGGKLKCLGPRGLEPTTHQLTVEWPSHLSGLISNTNLSFPGGTPNWPESRSLFWPALHLLTRYTGKQKGNNPSIVNIQLQGRVHASYVKHEKYELLLLFVKKPLNRKSSISGSSASPL